MHTVRLFSCSPQLALLFLLGTTCLAGPAHAAIISDFRVRGASGALDEFVRIYNETGTTVIVAATSGGSGWAVAKSGGTVLCKIPNGTIVPPGASFLCANSNGYSLSALPANAPNATYTVDIPDNAGIALFSNDAPSSFNLNTRLDAAGSTSEPDPLYREGAGYRSLTPFSIDYGFTRDRCGKRGVIGREVNCTVQGTPIDTNDNARDFVFVDTNGTSAGAGQRLGAPGPANLSAPVLGSALSLGNLDSCSAETAQPNLVQDFSSNPGANATFGTVDLRRSITNTSTTPITSLRFRIIDLSTFPTPTGVADLRPRTSGNSTVTVSRFPCGSGTYNVSVAGTVLESPPNQPNGGGFNSTLSVPSVRPDSPLAPGASVDVRFLLGIQKEGVMRFSIALEGSPEGGGIYEFRQSIFKDGFDPMP